jgi:outer membrane immunogenic protein
MTSLTKRVSLAAASAVVLSLTALPSFAADLDLPPPPPPLPELRQTVTDWTGMYVGAHLMVGCLEANYIPPGGSDPNMSGCAGMGGVYGGYNYQLGSSFVLGLEADYSAAFDGHLAFAPGPEDTNYYLNDLTTVRARAGWLANDSTMFYMTGGVGWMDTTFDGLVGPGADFTEDSQVLFGWLVGGGLETKVSQNFHIKAEYLYGQFEDGGYDLTGAGCAADCVVPMNVEDFHSFKVGASYNFSFGGGYTHHHRQQVVIAH